jgi:hypothetical protein
VKTQTEFVSCGISHDAYFMYQWSGRCRLGRPSRAILKRGTESLRTVGLQNFGIPLIPSPLFLVDSDNPSQLQQAQGFESAFPFQLEVQVTVASAATRRAVTGPGSGSGCRRPARGPGRPALYRTAGSCRDGRRARQQCQAMRLIRHGDRGSHGSDSDAARRQGVTVAHRGPALRLA